MSAPESTAVTPPPASPASPPAIDHVGALHRRLDEIEDYLGNMFHRVIALLQKTAPLAEAAGAVVSPALGAAAAAVEKVAGAVACCAHIDRQHNEDGSCAVCSSCPGLSKP